MALGLQLHYVLGKNLKCSPWTVHQQVRVSKGSDSPLGKKEEATPEEEMAPAMPVECYVDILVETEALIESMSGVELEEPMEVMEVVSAQQLLEPVVPLACPNQMLQ